MSKTNKKTGPSRPPAKRIAQYRAHPAPGGAAERLHALELRYEERRMRLRRSNPDSWLVCDDAIYQEGLAMAATPARSEKEALNKIAFLIPYLCADAGFSGQRHVAAMLGRAIDEEGRRWGFPPRGSQAA